jgi:tryptophanyl-tRNA synthetase
VMDLQHPERKMSKSVVSPLGTLNIADPPDEIVRKVRRAVTDTSEGVAYDPEHRPGVANLLDILSAATGTAPKDLAAHYSGYGALKSDVADALVELLRPMQEQMAVFAADPGEVDAALRVGADKARAVAAVTLARAREAIGLLPR